MDSYKCAFLSGHVLIEIKLLCGCNLVAWLPDTNAQRAWLREHELSLLPGPEVAAVGREMEAFAGDVEFAADGFHLRRDFSFLLQLIPRNGGRNALGNGLVV